MKEVVRDNNITVSDETLNDLLVEASRNNNIEMKNDITARIFQRVINELDKNNKSSLILSLENIELIYSIGYKAKDIA